jgi:peptidoglycan hydrolase-like protein with peptidoglycan-binding domain
MSADTEAYALSLRVSPELTEAEREYALLVCRHESFYGRATSPPAWVGSKNWGAVKGTGPAGYILADDEQPQMKFRRYNTDDEGWADVVRILLKPSVREALKRGDGTAAVTAQRANGYFTAPLASYHAALVRNYAAWETGMGRKGVLSFPPLAAATGSGGSVSGGSSSSVTSPFIIRRPGKLPTVWEGSFGNAVRVLCVLLDITPSDRFDARVRSAVTEFQSGHGLKVDGLVGEKTWEALLKAKG